MINCPSIQEIAAFSDKKLVGFRQQSLVAHLAQCADCYQLYSESAKTKKHLERERFKGLSADKFKRSFLSHKLSRKLSRKSWAWGIPVALGSFLFLFLWFKTLDSETSYGSKEWVAMLRENHSAQELLQLSERVRQDELAFNQKEGRVSQVVELGAVLIDFKIAMAASHQEKAVGLLKRISELDGAISSSKIENINAQIPNPSGGSDFSYEKADLVEQRQLRSEHANLLRFGMWIEAARIAANAKDDSFFQKNPVRSFRHLAKSYPFSERVVEILAMTAETMASFAASKREFERLHLMVIEMQSELIQGGL